MTGESIPRPTSAHTPPATFLGPQIQFEADFDELGSSVTLSLFLQRSRFGADSCFWPKCAADHHWQEAPHSAFAARKTTNEGAGPT